MALWGATAAGALLIAVLTTRSEVGLQRVAIAFLVARELTAPAGPSNDPIRGTPVGGASGNAALRGSGARLGGGQRPAQIAACRRRAQYGRHHRLDHPADRSGQSRDGEPLARRCTASAGHAGGHRFRCRARRAAAGRPCRAASAKSADAGRGTAAGRRTSPGSPPTEYGVDIGSALSIQALRARWLGMRSAHPQLFDGLTPTVMLREIPRSKRIELRLVVGPLANAEAAAQLCASLAPYRLSCQPTIFDRRHLALQ